MARMRRIRARVAVYHSAHELAALGVDLFFGAARFAGAHALAVGDARLSFRKALVATGARPHIPDIPGLEQAGYRTSDTVFDMPALPKRLAVMGGGPLGCELGQAFCRLGAHVTIVQNDPKFLPREERDAAEILSWAMARDGIGITLLPETVCADAVRRGDLEVVLPDWRLPQGIAHAVFASRRGLLPAVRVFIDFLAEKLPPLMEAARLDCSEKGCEGKGKKPKKA